MTNSRDIRRLAFQLLYQLDVRLTENPDEVLSSLMGDMEESILLEAVDARKAGRLAAEAYRERAKADAFMEIAAPGWPAHRQAAVDRAILRLAFFEMTSGRTPAKIAVNEAVELAKEFSTEKSPAFINGLLDKALKMVLGAKADAEAGAAGAEDAGAADPAPTGSLTPKP